MQIRIAVLAAVLVTTLFDSWAQNTNDLMFLHHSSGQAWFDSGCRTALDAKSYVDEVNEITYGTDVVPDTGRPDSLGTIPGDHTDMLHWILWFNDYLEHVKTSGCSNGSNKIVMFKSCFPLSNVYSDGTEPGDPFSGDQTLVNYKAVYRHPSGPGSTYSHGGYTYRPLEDIFAANPGILFIAVTAPSNVPPATCVDWADRARAFNDWLKNTWLPGYNAAHPTLHNVAVFDWFDVIAYSGSYTGTETYSPANGNPNGTYPVRNMTRSEYRSSPSDSHPNTAANQATTLTFATNAGSFIDTAYTAFSSAAVVDWEMY